MAARGARILVVDGDGGTRDLVSETLAAEGHSVSVARDAKEALELLVARRFDVVVSEIFLAGTSGIELVRRVQHESAGAQAILMARQAPARTVVAGMKAGAFDCVEKPIDPERLRLAVGNAVEHARLERENAALRRQSADDPADAFVCASEAMREVLKICDAVAPSDLTVLIEGESGVGKELVANRIHRLSPRAKAPLVAVNCGAIQAGLLEAELFGHEKGAFTGAVAERAGLFELADHGTLFLDEIGEMPLDLQVKLLRVLETSEFRRLGAQRTLRADVRVVAATNRRLAEEVRKGTFREDLFFRLNVIALEVPPLRRRREEIPALIEAFVEQGRRRGMARKRFAQDAIDALKAHGWPGNVRELENLVERALILCRTDVVMAADLPDLMRMSAARPEGTDDTELTLAELERRHIIRALRKNKGNKVRTARKLGINVKTLYNKIKAYEIDDASVVRRSPTA